MFEYYFSPFILFALCIPHSIFSILFLFTKNKKDTHDIIASIWILTLSMPILQTVIFHFWENLSLQFLLNSIVYPLFYGPIFFYYSKSLIEKNYTINYKIIFHLIPILFYFFFLASLSIDDHPHIPRLHPPPPPIKNSIPKFLRIAILIDFSILISILTYSYFVLKLLNQHTLSLENYFSNITEMRRLFWLKLMIYLIIFWFGLSSSLPILFKFFIHTYHIHFLLPHQFKIIHSFFFIIFNYIISFFTIKQDSIYFEKIDSANVKTNQSQILEKQDEKYSKSGLRQEEAFIIVEKIIQCMEDKKLYLKEDLRIRELSDELNLSVNYISESLNRILSKNFYQFVNEYRIQEVINKLENPKYIDYSILRIAFDSGFNSKSTFNSTFKKFTGKNPNEFRSKLPNT